jgi:hypothetical protein
VSDENPPSQGGAILIGTLMMVAGIGIFALGIAGREGSLNAPRWVVACAGGACFVFGLWIVTICSRGYDPRHPEVSPPPPALQRLFFIPGMLLFAAPFHWIAFGPGPRRFSTTFSIPFFAREGNVDRPLGPNRLRDRRAPARCDPGRGRYRLLAPRRREAVRG